MTSLRKSDLEILLLIPLQSRSVKVESVFFLLTDTRRVTKSAVTEMIHHMTAGLLRDLVFHRVWPVAR